MLNLLKWDFINFIKKYYWLYFSFAAVFIIKAVFPEKINGISAIYSMFFYCYSMIISAAVTISWLRKRSAQLELSLPAKPWKILLSKLVLSICISASGLILTKLLWMQIVGFGMSKIALFGDFIDFIGNMLGMLMLIIIIMFSYITAKSFSYTRNKAGIATVLLSIAIYMLIQGFASVLFVKTGVCTFAEVANYGEFYLKLNGKLSWLEAALSLIGSAAFITMFFLGSCILFKNRFERY